MTEAEETFSCWAPADGAWSPWAKPVLFAHLSSTSSDVPDAGRPIGLDWATGHGGSVAIVVDLPGVVSVAVGIGLARLGLRPVPLFNAVPGDRAFITTAAVWPIVDALRHATPELRRLLPSLGPDAPPAFLLDSARRVGTRPPSSGIFDNRSVSLPTDFPSASLLLHRGVRRVIVATTSALADRPQADLAHTLLRWQQAGIEMFGLDADAPVPRVRPITIATPQWYRSIWHQAIALLTLRPHPLGGFGGTLPVPSSG